MAAAAPFFLQLWQYRQRQSGLGQFGFRRRLLGQSGPGLRRIAGWYSVALTNNTGGTLTGCTIKYTASNGGVAATPAVLLSPSYVNTPSGVFFPRSSII